jgi:phytoene synthase
VSWPHPSSRDPVLVAVADAASRFPIPLAAFGDLVDGAEMDARGTVYETFAELERYCRCVAGSIGRLSLGVFDCSDRERGPLLADDLGVALQIGNILRDVGEDPPTAVSTCPGRTSSASTGSSSSSSPSKRSAASNGSSAGSRSFRCSTAVTASGARDDRQVPRAPAAHRERAGARLNGRLSLRPWEKGLVLARSLAGVGA